MDKAGVLQRLFRALVTQYAGWGDLGLFTRKSWVWQGEQFVKQICVTLYAFPFETICCVPSSSFCDQLTLHLQLSFYTAANVVLSLFAPDPLLMRHG